MYDHDTIMLIILQYIARSSPLKRGGGERGGGGGPQQGAARVLTSK